jgi:hypothetical protein
MEWKLKKLENEIQQLKDQLDMEIAVKKSEVQLNLELKEYNKKLELYIETQSEIIKKYAAKIVRLQDYIKKLTS